MRIWSTRSRSTLEWALLCVALAVASLCGSCKKKGVSAGDGGASGESATTGRDQRAKINVYIACINNLNPAVHRSREQYLSWVNAAKGPVSAAPPKAKGKTKGKPPPPPTPASVAGLGEVSRDTAYGNECFKRDGGLDEVVTGAPKNEALDSAGLAYKQAVDELLALNRSAYAYYEHGDYKTDNFKKGQELHKPLMDAFGRLDKATVALRAATDKIQDQATQEELSDLERSEGKKAAWHQLSIMRKAKALLHAVKANSPDATKADGLGDDYAKSWQEMKAWTDANKAEADKLASWGAFVGFAEELVTQLKAMRRAKSESKGKLPESGSGSVHKFVESYNSLADWSNRLHDN